MSTALVRSATYQYLSTPPVAGVDWVFPGVPFDQANVPWDQVITYGQTSRCFLVIFVGDAQDFGDHLFMFDGAGGRRVVPYQVSVEVYFEDISGDPLAALHKQDAVLDAVKLRLMADPSLGQPADTGLLVAAAPKLDLVRGDLERQGEGDTFAAWSRFMFDASVYEFAT